MQLLGQYVITTTSNLILTNFNSCNTTFIFIHNIYMYAHSQTCLAQVDQKPKLNLLLRLPQVTLSTILLSSYIIYNTHSQAKHESYQALTSG